MIKMILKSENITKIYNRKTIFKNVSFSINQGSAFAITGKNGSGKSTLVKILCGVLSPSKGTVSLSVNDQTILYPDYYPHIGLVSPYLNLYEEFSAEENLQFIKNIRGLDSSSDVFAEELLKEFGIYEHRKKEVKNYSSGMKQRLKYCAALIHHPALLVLDEPSSNLDEYGIEAVRNRMRLQKDKGVLLFATNDKDDLQYADTIYDIGQLNPE